MHVPVRALLRADDPGPELREALLKLTGERWLVDRGEGEGMPTLRELEEAKHAEAEAKKHTAAFPQIHVTSSEKGMGIAELRAAVLRDAGV